MTATERSSGRGLRICMVISSYHPVVGGAEKQLAQLARLMIEAGHEVRVITRRYAGLAPLEVIDGVEVHRVPATGPKQIAALRFLLGAARAIRAARPDVIHCHSMFSPAMAGVLGQYLAPRPLIVKPMCGGEATAIAAKPFGRRRIAILARKAHVLVAVSGEIERELRGLGLPAARIRRLPNGVDTERFRPCAGEGERDRLRARLGLPEGPLFIYAGRMAAQKRLPMLLRAWREAGCAEAGATLLIAGANRGAASRLAASGNCLDGSAPDLLDQPGLRLLGSIDDMAPYLRAVDVFVLPSAREGLSNALLEACASGLAVIAARIGGTEDFVTDGENGLLFAVDDGDALARALTRALADRGMRARLGRNAARTVAEGYDIRRTARRLLAEYADALGPAGPGPAPRGARADTAAGED